MRIISQVFLFAFLLSLCVSAKPRSEQAAYDLARRYFEGEVSSVGSSRVFSSVLPIRLTHVARRATAAGVGSMSVDVPAYYYIFCRGESQGFAIVPGDDAYGEFIGYSETGTLDEATMIPPLRAYLEDWCTAMDRGARRISTHRPGAVRGAAALGALPASVEPLMPTIKWGQDFPWNTKTPIKGGERCLVGCGATAMTQIMRYYKWPERGKGSFSYEERYDYTSHSVNFNTEYKWEHMPAFYAEPSPQASQEEQDALGTLAWHVGAAFQMTYGPKASGSAISNMTEPMSEYFSYDPGIKFLRRWEHESKWAEILMQELAEGRPVVYRAVHPKEAHIFVLEGYNAEGMFRVNWGWRGNLDGYFSLDRLEPPDWYYYKDGHYAIVGIKPKYAGHTQVALERVGNGSLTLEGASDLSKVPLGSVLIVRAKADFGWSLSELTVDGRRLLPGQTFSVNGPVTVRAVFVRTYFSVAFKSSGEGRLRLYGSDGVEISASEAEHLHGDYKFRVVPSPAPGWRLERLTANGVDITESQQFTLTEDTQLEAHFVRKFLKIEVVQEGEGSVRIFNRDNEEIVLAQIDTVISGSEVRIEAKSEKGWQLADLQLNGLAHDEENWVEMVEPVRFGVQFVPNTYFVSILASAHGTLRVEGYDRLEQVPHGTKLVLHPEPDEGYGLKSVLMNGEPLPAGETEITITEATDLQAIFATLGSLTSVESDGGFAFYPNPAKDAVHLRDVDEDTVVTLYSAEGVEVQHWIGVRTIHVGHLRAGVYLLRVGNRTARLVVAR